MPKGEEVKANIPSAFARFTEDDQEVNPVAYTDEEVDYRSFLIQRMTRARDAREQDHIEFDDKNYTTWCEDNQKAANSYNPPKKNKEDSRVVTGLTREKSGTLLSAMLNFNLDANITPFDKNDMKLYGVGEIMEDLVKKSRSLEQPPYESKRRLYYKEILDQGTGFVMEVSRQDIIVDKTFKDDAWVMGGVKVRNIKWDEKLRKSLVSLETEMISGVDVYLGNIKEFFIQRQPYVFTREVKPYDVAKQIYGTWDRWDFVPRKIVSFNDDNEENSGYNDWSLLSIGEEMVEIIKYFDRWNNEFMILCNGVMMLPIRFPLWAISPSGLYPIAKGDAEPISAFFAYSRSVASKTEVDQKTMDEILRMLLLKMKRSLTPPMANNTNKVISRKVMLPGKITKGINPDLLQPIGPTDPPNQSEYNMFSLMGEIANQKSIDPVFSGESAGGDITATEAVQRKQQQMMKLGQAIIGIVEFEKQLVELRVHNILQNWTKPIDERVDEARGLIESVYQSFNVESSFDDGRKGRRVISMNPKLSDFFSQPQNSGKIKELEVAAKKEYGEEIRFAFMNPEKLRTMKLRFDFDITPTEKSSSELDRVLFTQNIAQGYQLFGPQEFNRDYLKERWAILGKEDPDRLFVRQPQQAPTAQPGAEQPQQGRTASELTPQTPPQPSVNTLVGS